MLQRAHEGAYETLYLCSDLVDGFKNLSTFL